MRPSALAFLAVLAAAAAAWFLAVLPVHRKSADLAARIAAEDVAARRAAKGSSLPTAEEVLRMGKAIDRLRPPAAGPLPRGLAEETPGTFSGRLPWEEVSGGLAWASEQPRTVLEIEVRAIAGDPSRAAFRVVLGQ